MNHLRAFTIPLILLLAGAGNAQDSYYPLAEDATWTYRDTGGAEGKAVECQYVCLGRVAVKGGTCFELSYRRGKYRNFEYWSSSKEGVFRFHRGYLGGWRGVNRNRKPQRILAGPVGATLTWKWTETGSVQTMAGAPPPDPETLKIHYTARIEEMQDKVKVPAGEFTAVRVKITSTGFHVSDITWWFAKGIGPVKCVQKGRANHSDRVNELIKFTPGIEVKETAQETAKRFFAEKEKQPTQLVPMKQRFLNDHFRNQFFMARFKGDGKPTFLRVRRGVAKVFDPGDIEHWRALLKDEEIQLSNDAMGFGNAGQAARHCAQALALFVGELQGPQFKPYLRSSDFAVIMLGQDKTLIVKGQVRSGAGDQTPGIPVLMKFDTKTVIKIVSSGLPKAELR